MPKVKNAQPTDGEIEKGRLEVLIRRHDGNLTAIARALSGKRKKITRQGVAFRVKKYDLATVADEARATSKVPGPRMSLPTGVVDPEGEATRIVTVLAGAPTRTIAAKRLKMGRRTLFRRCQMLGITEARVRQQRQQVERASKK